ncbi:MAG: response regulator transcription factor [Alkalibacterium sp.]|nr:response regulator transcription factor [Alkalibacterium sp.]
MAQYDEVILIVEDDPQIRNFLCYTLENESFKYFSTGTAQGALNTLVSEQIDLIILDLGLPDFDGLKVIEKVREWSDMPIIIVSARDQDKEKANALDMGADDYLTKPFSATELLARIRVAFRHYFKNPTTQYQTEAQVGELKIDFEKRVVSLSGEIIHTTPMEYKLLSLFFKNTGKVLTTNYLLKEIWGTAYGNDTQALRTMMAGLRRKIEEKPAQPKYIITEIGVGYRLIEDK